MLDVIQSMLDWFYYARRGVVWLLAFLSLRLCGFEVTPKEVWKGSYFSGQLQRLDLNQAGDLSELLAASKTVLQQSYARRSHISDKCKTLLSVSSILLGLIGLFLPEAMQYESDWMRASFFVAALCLLNTLLLLLVFFDVGVDAEVDVGQDQVCLDSDNLRKSFINVHLTCQKRNDDRTNYLVDIYRTARFFFLLAFVIIIVLFAIQYF